MDIAVANGISNNVTILKNNGTGNFVEPASSPETAGAQAIEIVVADLDDDTDPDLAVANEGSDTVAILKNNGTGNFGQPASSPEPAGDDPHSLTAGDLDGDSDVDLAVTNQNDDEVTILKNNGTGNLRPARVEPGGRRRWALRRERRRLRRRHGSRPGGQQLVLEQRDHPPQQRGGELR